MSTYPLLGRTRLCDHHGPPNECDVDVGPFHSRRPSPAFETVTAQTHRAALPATAHRARLPPPATTGRASAPGSIVMSFDGQDSHPGGWIAPKANGFENENGRASMTIPPQPQIHRAVDLQQQQQQLVHQIRLQQRKFLIQQQELHLQQQLVRERMNTLQLLERKIRAGVPTRHPLADQPVSGNKRKSGI